MCIMLFTLHNYDVKVRNFMFCRGRELKTTTLFFFSWTSIQSCRIQPQKNFPTYVELTSWNKLDKVWSSASSLCNRHILRVHTHLVNPQTFRTHFKAVIIINWKGLLFFVILENPFTADFVVLNLSFYT